MSIDIPLKPNIIYRDRDFLIIEKPAGILVHPTKYQKKNTLVDWLVKNYPQVKDIGPKNRPGIVHRLDKDVSGLMVIAGRGNFFSYLIEQFRDGRVEKEYTALIYGRPSLKKGVIDLSIGRTKKGKLVAVRSRKKIKLEKEAITEYRIVRGFKNHSLLKVRPLTGRTHQIRLHFQSIGCPIVGDKNYSKKKSDLDRVFLHASRIGFFDLNSDWREFKSDLPAELKNFLNRLK